MKHESTSLEDTRRAQTCGDAFHLSYQRTGFNIAQATVLGCAPSVHAARQEVLPNVGTGDLAVR